MVRDRGDPAFFDVTKRIHNGLYGSSGDGGPLGAAEAEAYERTLRANAGEIDGVVRPGDIVILHDPQTAGLAPAFRRLGATIVWRCHVGSDQSNEWTERSWRFLRPHLEDVDSFVFSRRSFAPEWAVPDRTHVISPSINPFSTKNMHLTGAEVRGMLLAAGLITTPNPTRTVGFRRANGRRGVVRHRAAVLREGEPPPLRAPLVVQISRWDRMKDMAGVMAGFAEGFDASLGAHLVLAGPKADGVEDDPEAAQVFAECRIQWEALPAAVRRHVHLALLPTVDHDENAVDHKRAPAPRIGCLPEEPRRGVRADGRGGDVEGQGRRRQRRGRHRRPDPRPAVRRPVDDPTDMTEFAAAVDGLLRAPTEARRLGQRPPVHDSAHALRPPPPAIRRGDPDARLAPLVVFTSRGPLDGQRDPLAAADAQRRQAAVGAAPAHLVQQVDKDART